MGKYNTAATFVFHDEMRASNYKLRYLNPLILKLNSLFYHALY